METVELKLKQASAVLGVAPKELQNLVQFGVVKPRKRRMGFSFDTNVLLQAKVALYLKQSFGTPTRLLALVSCQLAKVMMTEQSLAEWQSVRISASPCRGKTPIIIEVPFIEIKKELEEELPMAQLYRDLPRGRRRRGWKQEFVETLSQAGTDIGDVSDADILKTVREYRAERRVKPEIVVVAQKKTA